jgi:hypothetical protein
MSDDDTRRQTSEDDDEAKLQRLIDEGVFDPGLPDDYGDVIRGLTPDEVEVISSINKRLQLVERLGPDEPDIKMYTKF